MSIFLENVLLGPTQGDIRLNPKSQKFRCIEREKKKKRKYLGISVGGLLFLPQRVEGKKVVGQASWLLQPEVVWEGTFPRHEQLQSHPCFREA